MSNRLTALACLFAAWGVVAEARATETVLNDSVLTSWQLLVPTGDPGIALAWPPSGNTFLEVHHRHTTDLYSVKRSVQGNPSAIYDPAVSGPVDSFTFAGDFRSTFEGAEPQFYSIITVTVNAAILQGGELFVAPTAIHVQIHGLGTPPDWIRQLSGTLGAADFWRNRTEEVHPDFSAGGAPMTLALEVATSFQTGALLTPEHLFEVNIDNVEVLAIPADGSGAPSLRFGSDSGIVDHHGTPTAIYVDEEDEGAREGRQLALPVRLSTASTEDVRFQVLRAQAPPPGEPQNGRVRAGNTGGTVLVPADRSAEIYRLDGLTGATAGVPSQALFLSSGIGQRPEHECVLEFLDGLFQGLGQVPSFPPPAPAAPVVLAEALLSGGESRLLSTLRSFRDELMMASPAGRYYSALYTTYSPDLRRAILRRPTVIFDLHSSYGAWLDALAALVAGEGDATPVTPDMATDLNRILDTLASSASPGLARAIAAERARLELHSLAGTSIGALWQRVVDRVVPEPCSADSDGLCLGSGGRYRVEADWKTPAGATGRGRAVPLSGDSGYFWFFDPANVELLTKVVDGCGLNQRIWSYSAGLTNLEVELFVFDTATGRGRTYRNPQATNFAPILDSSYLECEAESAPTAAQPPPASPTLVDLLGGAGCTPGPETLCLDGGRFRVEAQYRTAAGASGAARAVPLTDDTGTFWFFNAANIELVVKTIDACGLAGFENYWVFAGGTTDVEVTLRVTDTLHDIEKIYRRPLGVPFAPVLDSGAFATCP